MDKELIETVATLIGENAVTPYQGANLIIPIIAKHERDRILKELEGYCPHGNIKKRFCWRCYEAL